MVIFDVISVILIVAGLVLFLGASAGVLRFPDFYTRMHAAGKGDSLSSLLIVAGFAFHHVREFSLVGVLVFLKILAIGLFIMMTSPTSTHALVEAGYDDGIEPWTRKSSGRERRKKK